MKKPIKGVADLNRKHPIVWGATVFLLGAGAELLMTQRLVGSVMIEFALGKLGIGRVGSLLNLFLQAVALFLGLVLFALSVHLMVRIFYTKQGKFAGLLTSFLFISGIVSVVSTFITNLTRSGAVEPVVLVAIPLLSALVYVAAIRECYRIPFAHAAIAGLIPLCATIVLFMM
ncbi:MAG: hypothetical protein A2Z34_05265 [Planctomycetes bacterium RBG_16_59_8]|nr:MAG: hypothetical protein A2Z34_05265 [Planctomycetes bacterium RBG_16_59_8]